MKWDTREDAARMMERHADENYRAAALAQRDGRLADAKAAGAKAVDFEDEAAAFRTGQRDEYVVDPGSRAPRGAVNQ